MFAPHPSLLHSRDHTGATFPSLSVGVMWAVREEDRVGSGSSLTADAELLPGALVFTMRILLRPTGPDDLTQILLQIL